MDEIKNIKKLLSLSNLIASQPTISAIVIFLPVEAGGVLGSMKLNTPSIAEAADAMRKVLANAFLASHENQPMVNPAIIQPTVPHTRNIENCFSGLSS